MMKPGDGSQERALRIIMPGGLRTKASRVGALPDKTPCGTGCADALGWQSP